MLQRVSVLHVNVYRLAVATRNSLYSVTCLDMLVIQRRGRQYILTVVNYKERKP